MYMLIALKNDAEKKRSRKTATHRVQVISNIIDEIKSIIDREKYAEE